MSLAASGVAFVYRILVHMKCGREGAWRAEEADAAWEEYAATQQVIPDGFNKVDLLVDYIDNKRFKCYPDDQTGVPSHLLYLGYHLEDWSRAWILLNYIRNTVQAPWQLYKGTGRASNRVRLYFGDPEDTHIEQEVHREEVAQATARMSNITSEYQRLSRITEEINRAEGNDELFHLSTLLEKDPKRMTETELHKTRRTVKGLLDRYITTVDGSAADKQAPSALEDIVSFWREGLFPVLSQTFPEPRGNEEDDFVPNIHLSAFGGKVAQEYMTGSDNVMRAIADDLSKRHGALDDELPDDDAMNSARIKADKLMRNLYSLQTMTSGEPPPDIPFEEALEYFADIDGHLDFKTLEFNSANTRLTLAQLNAQSAAAPVNVDEDQSRDPAQEEIVLESFALMPHQVVGMFLPFICLLWT